MKTGPSNRAAEPRSDTDAPSRPLTAAERAAAGSSARRPDVAADVARAAAVVVAATRERLSPRLGIGPAQDAVAGALAHWPGAADVTDNEDRVVAFALSALDRHRDQTVEVAVSVASSEMRLRPLGFGPRRLDAVRRRIDAGEASPALIAARRTALAAKRWDRTAAEARLRSAYRSAAPSGPVATVIRELRDAGLDGERLADAVIIAETCRHTGLIWQRANRLAGYFPDRSPEDLFGDGWNGLRVALRAYDPSRFAFSTYAAFRIDGTIRDGVRSDGPVPKRLGTFARHVASTEDELTQRLRRAPTLDELAERLGREASELASLRRLAPPASIEELDETSGAPVVTASPAELDAERALAAAAARKALASIDPLDALAVRATVMDRMGPAEAARILALSPREVSERRDRALRVLRPLLTDWAPQPA
mgnify:CR=1 FL=1